MSATLPIGDLLPPSGYVWSDALGWHWAGGCAGCTRRKSFDDLSPAKKHQSRNPQIIAMPHSALRVIALSVGIEIDDARRIVKALAKAGFVVAPMEPTNSMFAAYVEALGAPSRRHTTVIQNLGKARKRWRAMATAGLAVVFSNFYDDRPASNSAS